MNEKLRTRVLDVLRHKRQRGNDVDPLIREGLTEREVINTVHELKEEGLILDNPSMQ